MSQVDLASIDFRSGVNEAGEGFCTVVATSTSGSMFIGQLSPDEMRQHALIIIGAAEAAEQDAAMLRIVRKLELPEQLAAAVIVELRNSRST